MSRRAQWFEGVPSCVDDIADAGQPSHRFLRAAWFAAAGSAYGGPVRTVVAGDGDTGVGFPLVRLGPSPLGLSQVAGCYWPFRTFVMGASASASHVIAALEAVLAKYRGVRIGPVAASDRSVLSFRNAADSLGCLILVRPLSGSWSVNLADNARAEKYPRSVTLKKNRYFERQLEALGPVDYRRVQAGEWRARIDALAAIESKSWIAEQANVKDAKFLASSHRRFWELAGADEILSTMLGATILEVGDQTIAFSFDLRAGPTSYILANSYDRQFGKFSPGRLVSHRYLQDSVASGVEIVDWGSGDTGYKQSAGARLSTTLIDLLVLRPGAASVAISNMLEVVGSRSDWKSIPV